MRGDLAQPTALVTVAALCLFLCGCVRDPPPSRFPSADDALARMHATYACSRGVQGEAKVDYYGDQGRVRGSVIYTAMLPEQVRLEVFSPFGVVLSTLTADGDVFALSDVENRQYLYGPASACNVARFTRVPVPAQALVQLLRGEAPVLAHGPADARIEWDGDYVVEIRSRHLANQEIRLEPLPEDWNLPWEKQRVRVLEVAVEQQEIELYRAELRDHRAARTAPARVDPDGLGADIPPSGPWCRAQVPRAVRLQVPGTDQDLVLTTEKVSHNPPLIDGMFRQQIPGGVVVRYADCGR